MPVANSCQTPSCTAAISRSAIQSVKPSSRTLERRVFAQFAVDPLEVSA